MDKLLQIIGLTLAGACLFALLGGMVGWLLAWINNQVLRIYLQKNVPHGNYVFWIKFMAGIFFSIGLLASLVWSIVSSIDNTTHFKE